MRKTSDIVRSATKHRKQIDKWTTASNAKIAVLLKQRERYRRESDFRALQDVNIQISLENAKLGRKIINLGKKIVHEGKK